MEKLTDIYALIKNEEAAFQTIPVSVIDGWEWNLSDHIKKTTLYKNSQYSTGKLGDKPFKNIIRPILNLQHRAEGFDVKDIQLYIDDSYKYFKSFLVKKFHEKWARENGIDTFIDDMVESYVDFGGALIKNVNEVKPEVVPWQRIAFCDQTDILSGTIAEKHFYAPDQLKEMAKKGWKNIDEVITLSENVKQDVQVTPGKSTKTPGRYIEVYEIHGMFPRSWLKSGKNYENSYEGDDAADYTRQLHIVCFYKTLEGLNQGITLYSGTEKELPYKFIARDKIYGRALGMGGAEELFEPQIWVNYDQIRIKGMLDAAANVVYQTTDQTFLTRNKNLNKLDSGAVVTVEEGKEIAQLNTQPVNMPAFENSISKWEEHARQMGAATESIMGEQPSSGTPFALQQLITAESHSLHEYRKGKLATFLDEVYQDWIIPYIAREITNGDEFLAELDLEELQSIAEALVLCETNKAIKKIILGGKMVTPEQVEAYKDVVREGFMKGGNKRFIKILEDELKDAPISVKVNIVGKQADLSQKVDKLVNVWRAIMVNPALLQTPQGAKLFNEILEGSGLSPLDFSGFTLPVQKNQGLETAYSPAQPSEVPNLNIK